MATWEDRLNQVFGPRGYENFMRRSLQTVILYEANRCVAEAMPSLRPFQRKIAFWDMANALIDSLSGLAPHQKEEVMWRTGTSKEPMQPETTWKRRKLLNKELEKISNSVSSLMEGRTYEEAVSAYIQQQYECVTGNSNQHPVHWEHAHNNAIMCYRLYYQGGEVDPNFPNPRPPKEVLVATEKASIITTRYVHEPTQEDASPRPQGPMVAPPAPQVAVPIPGAQPPVLIPTAQHPVPILPGPPTINDSDKPPDDDVNDADLEEIVEGTPSPDDRRLTLKEVREHLDLLKEFEGVIPQEELINRKRELFLALPPAPPPCNSKRTKLEG